MINFNFGGIDLEPLTLTVNIVIGDTKIQSQTLQMPYQMMVMQCQDLVNQVAQDQRPMKIEMIGQKNIELANGNTVAKPSKLVYANNAYTNNYDL